MNPHLTLLFLPAMLAITLAPGPGRSLPLVTGSIFIGLGFRVALPER